MQFHAVLRLIYEAESDLDAELMAMLAQQAVEGNVLELDHGDEASITYVGPETVGTTPAELVALLTHARNELILTKARTCWEVGKEIDRVIWHLERRDYEFVGSYDHGHFYEVAEKVLASQGESVDADVG